MKKRHFIKFRIGLEYNVNKLIENYKPRTNMILKVKYDF